MKHLALLTSLLLAPILLSTLSTARADDVAHVDPAKPLAESLSGGAKTDYDVGKVLFRDGDFEGARTRFESAYEKSKDPRLLFNVAASERNRNNYGRTIRLIGRYKKEADALLSDAEKKEADELIAALRSLVAPLTIDVNEADARVEVDDEVVGVSPLAEPILVEFRKHKVRAHKDGFEDRVVDVEVKDASGMRQAITLERPEGRLVIVARPEDTIRVDTKLAAMGRLEAVLPYGGHQVTVTAPGYIPYQSDITLQEKQPRTITVSLQREKGGGIPLWAWIGGGTVIAAGAVVAGYLAIHNSSTSEQGISSVTGTLGGVRVMRFR